MPFLLFTFLLLNASCAQAAPLCPTPPSWLAQLSSEHKATALAEIAETRQRQDILRGQIRQKMAELRLLRYDRQSSPETLPRLGRELMELRTMLADEQKALLSRLCERVGTAPGPHELKDILKPTLPKN